MCVFLCVYVVCVCGVCVCVLVSVWCGEFVRGICVYICSMCMV